MTPRTWKSLIFWLLSAKIIVSIVFVNMLKFLSELGFSDKEAAVYLALLEIGQNPANTVARKAGLSRTTTYSVLDGLVGKNFVSVSRRNKMHYYMAESPEIFFSILNNDIRDTNIRKRRLEELMPEILRMMRHGAKLPKVQFFEDFEGVQQVYEDTLISGEKIKYAFSPAPDVGDASLRNYLKNYVERRVAQGVRVKAIFPDSEAARHQQKNDRKLLRDSRLVDPEKFPFESEINIYAEKVAIVSLNPGNLHGVIIESKEISSTLKSIFNLAFSLTGLFNSNRIRKDKEN